MFHKSGIYKHRTDWRRLRLEKCSDLLELVVRSVHRVIDGGDAIFGEVGEPRVIQLRFE